MLKSKLTHKVAYWLLVDEVGCIMKRNIKDFSCIYYVLCFFPVNTYVGWWILVFVIFCTLLHVWNTFQFFKERVDHVHIYVYMWTMYFSCSHLSKFKKKFLRNCTVSCAGFKGGIAKTCHSVFFSDNITGIWLWIYTMPDIDAAYLVSTLPDFLLNSSKDSTRAVTTQAHYLPYQPCLLSHEAVTHPGQCNVKWKFLAGAP